MNPRIVILGAGFAGHTAALHLSRLCGERADITVVSPRNRFTWFPSLIWVGIGQMPAEEVQFALGPVYERIGVNYIDGRAIAINPDDCTIEVQTAAGEKETLSYNYCVNATGPYLNFEGTPGLGPAQGTTTSVCSIEHASQTRDEYLRIVAALSRGVRARFVIGVGHPAATCEGAAFEYLMNVDYDLLRRGLRDRAELVWLSNEPEPGDFGVDGIESMRSGKLVTGAAMIRALFDESGIRTIMPAGVTKVEPGRLHYEQVGEAPGELEFDFAMLIPQFRGMPLKYIDHHGNDITEKMALPSGFMRVDADYDPKKYSEYRAEDWPAMYRSPHYPNLYAAGIAFGPPHPLSKPKTTASGLQIIATAPRTGMASGIMGRTVAENIAEQVRGGDATHHMRMSEMPAACIASMGNSLWSGSAASIIMTPVARDFTRYPEHGRDMSLCDLEVGLAGAWTKRMLHSAFMWKLQAKPGWQLIPE